MISYSKASGEYVPVHLLSSHRYKFTPFVRIIHFPPILQPPGKLLKHHLLRFGAVVGNMQIILELLRDILCPERPATGSYPFRPRFAGTPSQPVPSTPSTAEVIISPPKEPL